MASNTLETLPEDYPQFSFNRASNKYRENSGFLGLQRIDQSGPKMTDIAPIAPVPPPNDSLTLQKYNSLRFDNLRLILEEQPVLEDGTVLHQSVDYSSVQNGPAALDEKENLPWMQHVKKLRSELPMRSSVALSRVPLADTPASSLGSPQKKPHSIEPIVQSTVVSSAALELLPSGLQSPLKLFSGDNYNTYTKQRFDNLISKGSPQESVLESSALESVASARKSRISHSRGNSQSSQPNTTRQVGDFLNYADNVFSDCLKRGPGVALKELLNMVRSGASDSGSYTSDDSSLVGDRGPKMELGNVRMMRQKMSEIRLPHPENETYSTIRDVTNNMLRFEKTEEEGVAVANETTNITHSFMDSYIEPRLVRSDKGSQNTSRDQSEDPVSKYDFNESLLNDMTLKKPKKLLKFAKNEVHIPSQLSGMAFDEDLQKWVKEGGNEVDEFAGIADLSVRNESHLSGSSSKNSVNSSEKNDITFTHQMPEVSSASQIDTTFLALRKALVLALLDVLSKNRSWELVKKIELPDKGLFSILGLDEQLPSVRVVNLDGNFLRDLEGLPGHVDNVLARGNKLGAATLLQHLRDLEIGDFHGNFFRTLSAFKNLVHLRYLNLSRNLVGSVSLLNSPGFQNLLSLDLLNNYLRGTLNLKRFASLKHLQELDVLHNCIENVDGVRYLDLLITLRADYNNIREIELDLGSVSGVAVLLKKLSLRGNQVASVNLQQFKNLRVLRINEGAVLAGLLRLHRLDELTIEGAPQSLRRQHTTYTILEEVCESNTLSKLNVTGCGISKLDMSEYHGLESLFCMFNRISNFQQLVKDVGHLKQLRKLDMRFNPITEDLYDYSARHEVAHGYYNKLVQKQDETMEDYDIEASEIEDQELEEPQDGIHSMISGDMQKQWSIRDARFVESLRKNNPNVYRKRVYYQGLLLSMFKRLKYMDGLVVTKELRSSILDEWKTLQGNEV